MKNKLKKNPASLFFAVLLGFTVLYGNRSYFKLFFEKEQLTVLSWDTYGYYLYLPAFFIYDDIGLQNKQWTDEIFKKYNPSFNQYQIVKGEGDKWVIIYHMGTSIILAPAFLAAHFLARFSDYPQDGFSNPYQLALIIFSAFSTWLGIFILRRNLLHFFSDSITTLAMVIIVLGTNFYITNLFSGVSPHNYIFTLLGFVLWFTIKWHETFRIRYAILLGFVIGLATISRPTEFIAILIPLFWNVSGKVSFLEKFALLKKYYFHVIGLISAMAIMGLPQLIYWKFTSGSFFTFNLHGESLSLFDPYTFKFLFSYKKGWLLYTPLMLFAILGFWSLGRRNLKISLPFISFSFFAVYVLSSWECWWYAASFGQRSMVQSYALLAVPLGFFLQDLRTYSAKIKIPVYSLMIVFFALNLFQSWQFLNGIIDPGRMTKKYYWLVFAQTAKNDDYKKFLEVERELPNEFFSGDESDFNKHEIFNFDFESNVPGQNPEAVVDTMGLNSKHCLRLGNMNFSPAFEKEYGEITDQEYMWVRASVDVFPTSAESNSCLVIYVESKKRLIKYRADCADKIKLLPNQWNRVSLEWITPEIRHSDDKLVVYYYNIGTPLVYIDNLKAEVLEPKTGD